LYEKTGSFPKHALNSMVRGIMELLKETGVSRVVGHPKDITKKS
jgi:putative transposase